MTGEKFDPNAEVETRTHTYSTGSVYEGEWKGGMRHGKGKMTYRNGMYEGGWKDDKIYGFGVKTFENGTREAAFYE